MAARAHRGARRAAEDDRRQGRQAAPARALRPRRLRPVAARPRRSRSARCEGGPGASSAVEVAVDLGEALEQLDARAKPATEPSTMSAALKRSPTMNSRPSSARSTTAGGCARRARAAAAARCGIALAAVARPSTDRRLELEPSRTAPTGRPARARAIPSGKLEPGRPGGGRRAPARSPPTRTGARRRPRSPARGRAGGGRGAPRRDARRRVMTVTS